MPSSARRAETLGSCACPAGKEDRRAGPEAASIRPHMSDSGKDLLNAVQDWVAHELRGQRPSSLDYPRSGTRAGAPGAGIPGVTLRSSA
jgi:hypothetical protein